MSSNEPLINKDELELEVPPPILHPSSVSKIPSLSSSRSASL